MADQQRVKSYHSCDALMVVGFSFGLLLGVVFRTCASSTRGKMIEIHASRSLELNDVVVYVIMPKPRTMGGSNPITKRVRKKEIVMREACPKICPPCPVR